MHQVFDADARRLSIETILPEVDGTLGLYSHEEIAIFRYT